MNQPRMLQFKAVFLTKNQASRKAMSKNPPQPALCLPLIQTNSPNSNTPSRQTQPPLPDKPIVSGSPTTAPHFLPIFLPPILKPPLRQAEFPAPSSPPSLIRGIPKEPPLTALSGTGINPWAL